MVCDGGWVYYVEEPHPEVRRALQGAGLERAEPGPGGGLLFFKNAVAPAEQKLRELADAGMSRVLVVTETGRDLPDAVVWRLLDAGADDVVAWDRLTNAPEALAARLARWVEIDALVDSPQVRQRLVGQSSAWRAAVRQLVEAALFTSAPVLLLGESGTGKEAAARLIHELDPNPQKTRLVTLDCTTVVPELSGSEFFGHERGAFTGAISARDGAFALADRGTLFLDEVGELPVSLQAQLLRAVQERAYKRVGGNTWQEARFRLICATNRDLDAEVASGGFRRDFFHRIASWTCRLPPLRERSGDILLLAQHFLREARPDVELEFDEPVRAFLASRAYPGNVRELRHLVMRIAHRHAGGGLLTVGGIPPEVRPRGRPQSGECRRALVDAVRQALAAGAGLKEIGKEASELAINLALDAEQGNVQRAARRLGVSDRALQLRRAQQNRGAEQLDEELS